ncbi:hypothetical protein [Streptomyces botrytidirepellens]|uniref:Uncharacterized protein n=1 Tax=Streptomyces botrytidirepellens TaxID=2486417 RepID=A0A3M8VGB0_9ACTN|nr:hypothetical protein [Streptomyces botrytidirepellens]RNG16652.1 hypothetical protein EEJ42_30760 [Streptomyces botrytidirepellens]
MSDYSEYQDKANGIGKGKHSKNNNAGKHRELPPGGDQGVAGGSSGCMVAALPVTTLGALMAVVLTWTRKR